MEEAAGQKDSLLFSREKDSPVQPEQYGTPWKIIIADDDRDIHSVTDLIFGNFVFQNRRIEFINTYSGKETLSVLKDCRDAAVILLDVVMEENQTGLDVARCIREDLNNRSIRIILRTGQPGQAPEENIITDYDINDYLNKTELTSMRLKSSIITSLRSYKDIMTIVEMNRELEKKVKQRTEELSDSLNIIRKDEEAGKIIQFKLLPENDQLLGGEYRFTRSIYPSLFLSGDFVDYFQIDDRYIGFYIADVSGHGASSAFITVYLKTLISGFITNKTHNIDETVLHPSRVLDRINHVLLREALGKYLTITYAIIDTQENTLTFSTGGLFPFPLFFDGEKTEYLRMKGPPVGLMKLATFRDTSIDLPPRFSLFFCSDGILEYMPESTIEQQEQNLLDLFSRYRTIPEISGALKIRNESSLPDDITFLLIRRGEQ